ncbi:MAG: molecular chaperone HscA, partial [Actinoplanes sp.]|nr:molecular chaperone HscA [Actinoplanes sp.]
MTDRRSSGSLFGVYSRLAIDYGAATVRAVVVTRGDTTPLLLEGADEMSTAVHVSSAGIEPGAAAWRRAASDPDGFVYSPLRVKTDIISVAGVEVEVVELVAATLRQVAAAAELAVGEPVHDVRLVVPAHWGPRRQTWLRHAARSAGLTARLVDVPVAALSEAVSSAVGAEARPVLVLDVGAGCEVSVVQPGADRGQVVSTRDDSNAGGDGLDAALWQVLTGGDLGALPAERRWPQVANVRAARHGLSEQFTVLMPMPDGQPPMVVNSALVSEAVRPVFERVADLAVRAMGNADLTVEQIGSVYLIGGAAVTPGAAEMVAARLGAAVQVVDHPAVAAVRGAADAPGDPRSDRARLRVPPFRRLVNLGLPGVMSLALYAHFVLAASFNNGTPDWPGPGFYVLASWGELAVAAILAMLTSLQVATLFAGLLEQRAPTGGHGSRISGGITAATTAGLVYAAMGAVTAAVLFNYPIGALLRWALLPILPIAAAAGAVAVLAWRGGEPTRGWDNFLAFPASATLTASVGIASVSMWSHGRLPWW